MKLNLRNLLKENLWLAVFIGLMAIFRSAVADWSDVPTGSMKPTIIEGDRIYINKLAYDLRLPFTHVSLFHRADPQRGDIIIFDSAVSELRLVKRVIGLPGDVISMQDNELTVNGEPLAYSATEEITLADPPYTARERLETLGQRQYRIRLLPGGRAASFPALRVPPGHYFVLGDNRNNSADSRYIGFVPREEIIGSSERVVLSLDYEDHFLPRGERFLHSLY